MKFLKLVIMAVLFNAACVSAVFAQDNLDGRGKVYSPNVELAKGEVAGFVITARGTLTATNKNGAVRALERRSKFYANETLKTGADSTAQLRFKDHALMNLKPNTSLKIGDYHFGGAKDTENQSFMELLAGGFRTISGSIGKLNKSAYRIDTPAASIGIRGTDYEVVISAGGKVFAAVHEGGIVLVNDIGELNLGADSDYMFAEVTPGQAPSGLGELPDLFVKVNNGESQALNEQEKQELQDKLAQLFEQFGDFNDGATDLGIDFTTFKDSAIQSTVFGDLLEELGLVCRDPQQCG